MKLSVIIPCYNEESTIETILNRVINNNYNNKEIIVIDDCSNDNSKNIIQKYKNNNLFKIIFNDKNMGKGFCLREAINLASGDICIIQDADLEYDPAEHIRVIQPILDGKADVVYGSRFTGKGISKLINLKQRFGNYLITSFCNLITNLNLTDVETCFKAIKTKKLRSIKLKENSFGIEPEITIKLAKIKCNFHEVGINYHGRSFSEGKKISWFDGILAMYCIVRYSLYD